MTVKIWNHLQMKVEQVKEEDAETIRYFEGTSYIRLSNGVWLRSLRDGRYVEDGTEDFWTEAYEEDEDGEIVYIGLFYRI